MNSSHPPIFRLFLVTIRDYQKPQWYDGMEGGRAGLFTQSVVACVELLQIQFY